MIYKCRQTPFGPVRSLDFIFGRGMRIGYIPKDAPCDTDEALWTQFSGETPGIVQCVKDGWCEVYDVLVCAVGVRA